MRGTGASRRLARVVMATSMLCVASGVLAHPGVATTGPWTWTYQQPRHAPPDRESFGLAYDPTRGNTVLFGGLSATGTMGDTWTWDGADWTLLGPFNSPEPRYAPAMAFDPHSQQVMLYGGQTNGLPTNDTWGWDGSDWTQLHPPIQPPPRAGAQMSLDPVTGNLILFGGYTHDFQYPRDTWSWDGTTWTQLQPAISPPGRAGQAMATGSQLVLFGGYTGSGYLNDTWVWDGSTWVLQHPVHAPIPRTGSMAAGVGDQVALFGGMRVVNNVAHWRRDTWYWTGSDWSGGWVQDSLPTRAFGGMAFDQINGSAVVFGGEVQGRLNNGTWTLAPS